MKSLLDFILLLFLFEAALAVHESSRDVGAGDAHGASRAEDSIWTEKECNQLLNLFCHSPVKPPKKRVRPPKGYQSNKSIIDRRTSAIMRDNPSLEEFEARQKALAEHRRTSDKRNEYKRNKRAEARALKPSGKIGLHIKKPGAYTKEARIERKIDKYLSIKKYKVYSLNQAKDLAAKEVSDENEMRLFRQKVRRREEEERKKVQETSEKLNV